MQYDEFLAAGYPIGSGVAEAACRHLVKDRMEATGMGWTVSGDQGRSTPPIATIFDRPAPPLSTAVNTCSTKSSQAKSSAPDKGRHAVSRIQVETDSLSGREAGTWIAAGT